MATESLALDSEVGVDLEPRVFQDLNDIYATEAISVAFPLDTWLDTYATQTLVYETLKRSIDIIGAIVLLILSAPVWVVAAALTKLTDSGPIFYVHKRVGKNGREFECAKFRSMIVNAEHLKADLEQNNKHGDNRTFKLEDDPRITKVGRILRKLSIDELPQLWNVLRGDMSLVGPRAPIPPEVALYNAHDQLRLSVRPGLTCIWQVSGRSNLAFPEQLRLDLEYIEQRNTLLDFKLLLLTVPAVISCRGAC